MATFHAADLFVAVVPDTSKVGPEMEKAGKDAKDKFGSGIKDIGKPVIDAMKKAGEGAGKDLKDAIVKAGKDGGASLQDNLTKAGANGGKAIASGLKVSDGTINEWAGTIGGMIGGKIGDAIHGLDGPLKSIGIDIGAWQAPIQDAVTQARDFKSQMAEVTGAIKDVPGAIGRIGTMLEGLAGPLATVYAIVQGLDSFSKSDYVRNNPFLQWAVGSPPDNAQDKDWHLGPVPFKNPYWWEKPFLSPPKGGAPSVPTGPLPPGMQLGPGGPDVIPGPPPAHYGGAGGDQNFGGLYGGGGGVGGAGGTSWTGPAPRAPAPSAPAPSAPEPSAPSAPAAAPSYASSMPSSFSSRGGLHAAGSSVANLYALAKSLVGTPYSMQLRNDCSGMVSKLATAALGMQPSVQFDTTSEGAWLASHGFQPGLGGPGDLNIGWTPLPGSSGHTAATLPGGINAESGGSVGAFALGGSVGAASSQFSQHAHLAMGGGGGGAGDIPTGAQHDPIYTADADGGGADGGAAGGADDEGNQYAQQFGSALVSGIAQGLGLDGSVFKSFTGKGPLDWGITKLGMGALNLGLKYLMPQQGGGAGGMPGGGGAGGIGQGILGAVGAGGIGAGGPGGGDTHNYNAPQNQFNVNLAPGQGESVAQPLANYQASSDYAGAVAGLPGN